MSTLIELVISLSDLHHLLSLSLFLSHSFFVQLLCKLTVVSPIDEPLCSLSSPNTGRKANIRRQTNSYQHHNFSGLFNVELKFHSLLSSVLRRSFMFKSRTRRKRSIDNNGHSFFLSPSLSTLPSEKFPLSESFPAMISSSLLSLV